MNLYQCTSQAHQQIKRLTFDVRKTCVDVSGQLHFGCAAVFVEGHTRYKLAVSLNDFF